MNKTNLYNNLLFKEIMLKKKQLKKNKCIENNTLSQRKFLIVNQNKNQNKLKNNQNQNQNQKKAPINKFPSYLYDKSQNSVSIIRKKWK